MNNRKHKYEMIRFANSEVGTKVLVRRGPDTWIPTKAPFWDINYTYIVDDEYAELRIASVETKRPIQIRSNTNGKWYAPTLRLDFTLPIENYRLRPESWCNELKV